MKLEELYNKSQYKKLILISGASSSGKSFAADSLRDMIVKENKRVLQLSTDDFYKSFYQLVLEEYEEVTKFLPEIYLNNKERIKQIIKEGTQGVVGKEKFSKRKGGLYGFEPALEIQIAKDKFDKEYLHDFCEKLYDISKDMNFDRPNCVDLEKCSKVINTLINSPHQEVNLPFYNMYLCENKYSKEPVKGEDFDVIILEGLYALNDKLLSSLDVEANKIVKSFIDADPISLLARKLTRDITKNRSGLSNGYVVVSYFKNCYPGYKNTVLLDKNKADIIISNPFNKEEKKYIMKSVQIKYPFDKISNSYLKELDLTNSSQQIDYYIKESETGIVLRVRETDGKITELTYKVEDGNILDRPTENISLRESLPKKYQNAKNFIGLLESVGYKIERIIAKQRDTYLLGDSIIHVDSVKGLGDFVEFVNMPEHYIESMKKKLNLKKSIKDGYYKLMTQINKEEENKYTLIADAIKLFGEKSKQIKQTYLKLDEINEFVQKEFAVSTDGFVEARLREINGKTYFTMKSDGLGSRNELKDRELTKGQKEELENHKKHSTIIKERILIHDDEDYEIVADHYLNGDDKMVAEIEYRNGKTKEEADKFIRSKLFNLIDKEVTEDKNYKNKNIAKAVTTNETSVELK